MNRSDFYFRQKVTESELDGAFDDVETALWALSIDNGLVGIVLAMVAAQNGSPNLSVNVSGPGVAYDSQGRRIAIPSTQNVPVSADESALSTTVAGGGNEKWLSVFVEFDRDLSDPRIDGNAMGLFFTQTEGFRFVVRQGAEAGSGLATRPALDSGLVLVCDILRTFGVTTILNAAIYTNRRQDAQRYTSGSLSVAAGTPRNASAQILGHIATHVDAAAGAHAASAIAVAGRTDWLGGVTNPAATAQAAFEKLITDLSQADPAEVDGAGKIGAKTSGGILSAGTVRSQLDELLALDTAKLAKAGGTMSGNLVMGGTTLVNFSAPRTRVFKIGLRDFFTANAGTYGAPSTGPTAEQLVGTTNFEQFICDLTKYLHDGETITNIRAIVDPGAARAGANRSALYLNVQPSPDFTTPANNPVAPTVVYFCFDDATANKQTLSLLAGGGTPGVIANQAVVRVGAAAALYVITLLCGNTAAASNDVWYGVEVEVLTPGYRTH